MFVLAPVMARADDDQNNEKSIWNLDKRIMNEVLYSFGLTKKPHLDQQFEYQDRARLELPPNQELPAPQAVDPKVARRQEKPRRNWRELDPDEFANPLSPRELRAGGAPAVGANRAGGDAADPTDPLPPARLGSSGGFFGLFSHSPGGNSPAANTGQQQSTAAAAEPPRRNLLDPPPGYLTPSPNQPYAGTQQRAGNNSAATRPDHALGDDQGL